MKQRFFWIVFVTVMLTTASVNACSIVGDPPLKVSGKYEAAVIDSSGARVLGAKLQIVDQKGLVVTQMEADSRGEFVIDFGGLPAGIYNITTTSLGWMPYAGQVDVRKLGFHFRKKWLLVQLGVGGCNIGGVSKRKPPRFSPA